MLEQIYLQSSILRTFLLTFTNPILDFSQCYFGFVSQSRTKPSSFAGVCTTSKFSGKPLSPTFSEHLGLTRRSIVLLAGQEQYKNKDSVKDYFCKEQILMVSKFNDQQTIKLCTKFFFVRRS